MLTLTLLLGGCSTPKKLDQSINKAEKSRFVEQVKNKLVLFSKSSQTDNSSEIFKSKLSSNWQSHNNVEPRYSFKYPLTVSLNQPEEKAPFLLKTTNLRIERTNASGTVPNEDLLVMAKNIQNGDYDNFWGDSLEDSRIISKIDGVNYREELLLTGATDCELNFERKLVFFADDYLVTLSLIAPADKILTENPDFFKVGPEDCQNKQIWKFERQSEFYLMLKENSENKTAQEWFNLFDLIKESLKIGDNEVTEGLIHPQFINNDKNLTYPELSIKAENINNDIQNLSTSKEQASELDYYVTFDKNNYLSLSFFSNTADEGKYLSSRNYNLKSDQILEIKDIIKEEKLSDLFTLVNAKFQENIKKYEVSEYRDRAFSVDDLNNFNLTNEGIRFNYGRPSNEDKFTPQLFATISYEELKDYFKLEIKK